MLLSDCCWLGHGAPGWLPAHASQLGVAAGTLLGDRPWHDSRGDRYAVVEEGSGAGGPCVACPHLEAARAM